MGEEGHRVFAFFTTNLKLLASEENASRRHYERGRPVQDIRFGGGGLTARPRRNRLPA